MTTVSESLTSIFVFLWLPEVFVGGGWFFLSARANFFLVLSGWFYYCPFSCQAFIGTKFDLILRFLKLLCHTRSTQQPWIKVFYFTTPRVRLWFFSTTRRMDVAQSPIIVLLLGGLSILRNIDFKSLSRTFSKTLHLVRVKPRSHTANCTRQVHSQ